MSKTFTSSFSSFFKTEKEGSFVDRGDLKMKKKKAFKIFSEIFILWELAKLLGTAMIIMLNTVKALSRKSLVVPSRNMYGNFTILHIRGVAKNF